MKRREVYLQSLTQDCNTNKREETMYRKVSVGDSLPKEENTYFTAWEQEGRTIIIGSNYFNGKLFEDDEHTERYAQPDYWLEEIPSQSSLLSEKDKELQSAKEALIALDKERAYWYEKKDKEIEILKADKETYKREIYSLNGRISQLSQSDSKGWYVELLEWVTNEISKNEPDAIEKEFSYKSHRLLFLEEIKEKILSLSSKEERKVGFSEEKLKTILHSFCGKYHLHRGCQILDSDIHDFIQSLISKVEAKPMGIEECKHPKEFQEDYHDASILCRKCNCIIEQFGVKINPPYKL